MARFALWLLLVIAAAARAERLNKSASAGLFWSSAKEEADLVRMADPQEDPTAQAVNEHDGLDGGFSSLDGMLQWAIGRHTYALISFFFFLPIFSSEFV